ncbi:hypothetical protein ACFVJM_30380 [Streptomyces virginiae]|uniref:hypothetical protein n=1 Tax=Streptomyces virginiae TaxID=1961 RepID=UPI0036364707
MPLLFGRGRSAFAVPVPQPDDPEPYDRQSLERVGGAVFAALPAQMRASRAFQSLLADFDANPQKLAARRRGAAIGTGVGISDLPVYVLPAVAWVLGVVGERATGSAAAALGDAARRKAAALLGSMRQPRADRREGSEPPAEPTVRVESGAEAEPVPTREPAPAGEGRTAWTEEERTAFVTAFQVVFAQRLGLEADAAATLAQTIAAALDARPQPAPGE